MEWSFRVFGDFLWRVIMKEDAQKNILFHVHLQESKIFLALRNLRYEQTASLSERSLQRSEFDKAAHALSRFLRA